MQALGFDATFGRLLLLKKVQGYRPQNGQVLVGMSGPQREALRDRYWVENGRFPSLHLLALVSGLVALAAAVAWKPPSPGIGRRRLAGYGVVASLIFVFSYLLLFAVTRYLWN